MALIRQLSYIHIEIETCKKNELIINRVERVMWGIETLLLLIGYISMMIGVIRSLANRLIDTWIYV
jgi:hypothetical protein